MLKFVIGISLLLACAACTPDQKWWPEVSPSSSMAQPAASAGGSIIQLPTSLEATRLDALLDSFVADSGVGVQTVIQSPANGQMILVEVEREYASAAGHQCKRLRFSNENASAPSEIHRAFCFDGKRWRVTERLREIDKLEL